jgi:phospho-N-acetylmuramoyl-pentapeptide-transferase
MNERVVFAASLAALLMFAAGRFGIPVLQRRGLRKAIREEAPARHQTKAGTPTMGGIFIILAAMLAAVAALQGLPLGPGLALLIMLGYGVLGAADDLLGIRRGRNLGLRARERLAVQIPLAVLAALYVAGRPELGTALVLPYYGDLDLGWGYVLFAILYVVFFANAVNLTDGLDGLAGGTVGIASAAYAVIALRVGQPEMAVLAAAVAGSCLGFVWFNAYPAAVIMGDVGSNALGAVLAAMAIITKTELTLAVVGAVFVVEGASVLLQVGYFKSTGGRRLFRMTPIHHHFELAGWTETQTVTRFWLLAGFAALFGLTVIF